VMLRVHAASICGTDLHIFEWNEWAAERMQRLPMTFGHEVAGSVESTRPQVHHL
jgi:threonine 3-dehydrogenase